VAKPTRLLEILGELGFPKDDLVPVNLKEARQNTYTAVSTGPPPRKAGCGKVSFTSESACKAAIKRRLNHGANTSRLRAYFCPACAAYHMSSSFFR
jgi:hypothetical protein